MVFVYGDNIDTDRIIPGKYTKTLDLSSLADHVLEDLDPNFSKEVKEGDILVVGYNFGCGSSREQAPLALKQAGISLVIASDFARIFFRNAINIGLPVLEIGQHTIKQGHDIDINLKEGIVINKTAGQHYKAHPMPDIMLNILAEGGLVSYLQKHKDYQL